MYITRDLQVTKLYISPRLMKILNMEDSINCEQPERLREAFTGVQGAGPWRGLQGGSAPLQENFVFGKLNMHNFRSFLVQITKIYDFLWSQA